MTLRQYRPSFTSNFRQWPAIGDFAHATIIVMVTKVDKRQKKPVRKEKEAGRELPDGAKTDIAAPTGYESAEKGLALADPFQLYISQIRQYPPLSREEERELAILYKKTGDREAVFRLVTSHLMLVVKLAFEFRSQFQNMLDLIQEGNYGLMRAVEKFDPFKGTRLSTYSSYWIRAYMMKFLLDNWRLVKVGTTNIRRKLLYRLKEIESKLGEGGVAPTAKLLAEHFGASEDDVIEVQKSLGAADKSIHQTVSDDSTREVAEVLPGKEHDYAGEIEEREVLEKFREAVERFKVGLKPSDLTLIESRILSDEPLTLQQIGDRHGITREAVRQAEGRLMKRLKKYLSKELSDIGEIDTVMDR
ncbi:RNA polymerase sigma factor RpoH [hydrothermal vent metagenome]|uniref:RNA polymerase sigma factor RpoH n=1 Tax=hydrothermal vent metagenome TaxID=652676 RepID=A0A3B1BVA4_9ZZZZ